MSDTRQPLNKPLLQQAQQNEKNISQTPFDQHPDVSRQIIFPKLNVEDHWSLTRTSKNLNQLFGKLFDKTVSTSTLKLLHQQLLEHVIYGEEEKAQEIMEKHPILLLYKGKVTDYSGRKIKGTAYQMALGAEDIEMAEMIQGHLKKLPDGLAEIIRQQKQQFPSDEKNLREENLKEIKALEAITQFICDAKEEEIATDDFKFDLKISERCQIALAQFRSSLDPASDKVITQGKHFNLELLLKALELYERHYDTFGTCRSSAKNMLFWRQVIGYIQRLMPACYAQAFCQGLYYVVVAGNKLRRSLNFINNRDIFFFPNDSDPHYRLGYEYGVGDWNVWDGPVRKAVQWGITRGIGFVRSLSQIKAEGLKKIMSRPILEAEPVDCGLTRINKLVQ